MKSSSDQYNIAAIRNLIKDAFTARDLWRFCHELPAFQPVLIEYGYNAGLGEMIDVLTQYCQTRLLFDELLLAVRETNPRQYERYQAQLYSSSTAPIPAPQIPHNLPPRSEFVGREAEKARIHEALRSRYFLISIDGIGGIGKTSLALEVAYECLRASQSNEPPEGIVTFDSFVWTTAKDRDLTLNALLDAIAVTLDYPGIVQRPLYPKWSGVEKLLRERSCLLLVDNFETVADDGVRDFLHHLPEPSKALITTRERKLDQVWSISLEGLDKSETLTLIRNEGRRLGLPSVERVEDRVLLYLYEATGGAPLAIKWSVGQIKQRGQSVDTVLASLHHARGSIYEDIFARSWGLLSGDAQHVLMVMPLFATSASRVAIEAASNIHYFALDDALGQLVEMSLIDPTDDLASTQRRYSIHPLTRAYVVAKIGDDPKALRDEGLRLAKHFQALAQAYESDRWGADLTFFESTLPNIVATVRWCWEHEHDELGVDILRNARYLMISAGYWNELLDLSTPMHKCIPSFDSVAIAGILGPGGARCLVQNPSIPSS